MLEGLDVPIGWDFPEALGSSAHCDVFSNLSLVLLRSTHSFYLAYISSVKRRLGACDAVHEVILFGELQNKRHLS